MCFSNEDLNDVALFQLYGGNKLRHRAIGVNSLYCELMSADEVAVSIRMFNRAHHSQQLEVVATNRNRPAI